MKKPQRRVTAIILPAFFLLIFSAPLFSQTRSLTELFPTINNEQRSAAFSSGGYLYYGKRTESLTLVPRTTDNTAVAKSSLGNNPGFFVEALRVIPRSNTSLTGIYNALGKVRELQGRNYYSETSKKERPLFTDSIRIEGPEKLRSFLPDPPTALSVPYRETFYVRFTDARFGHCYYEISIAASRQGILYKITNFKTVTFGPFPVMRTRTFVAFLYIEQIKEGLAVYCLAGAEASDFVLKYVDVGSAVNKRMDVIIAWMLDGIQ